MYLSTFPHYVDKHCLQHVVKAKNLMGNKKQEKNTKHNYQHNKQSCEHCRFCHNSVEREQCMLQSRQSKENQKHVNTKTQTDDPKRRTHDVQTTKRNNRNM